MATRQVAVREDAQGQVVVDVAIPVAEILLSREFC